MHSEFDNHLEDYLNYMVVPFSDPGKSNFDNQMHLYTLRDKLCKEIITTLRNQFIELNSKIANYVFEHRNKIALEN